MKYWTLAAGLCAAVLTASTAHAEDQAQRLVELLDVERGRGTHDLDFSAPTTSGRWFLSLERSRRSAAARVTLNGRPVARSQGRGTRRLLVEVPLQASNRLRLRVRGRGEVHLRLVGVAPESKLPNGTGQRVAQLDLLDERLEIESPCWWLPRLRQARYEVVTPGTEGLFLLDLAGSGPLLLGKARWNGEEVASFVGARRELAELEPQPANELRATVLGWRGAALRSRVQGYVVDEQAPSLAFSSPAPNAVLGTNDTISLTYADSGVGLALETLRIELDGVDVTEVFTRGPSGASANASELPLSPGTHTLSARIRDRACNEAQASVSFQVPGGQGPVIRHPSALRAECRLPQGARVAYTVTTTPGATLTCAPASGSVFPVGSTTVTCTATDATGTTTETFVILVEDTRAPVLGEVTLATQRADLSTNPYADLALIDVDGDGDLDLVACGPGGLELRLGNGAGGLSAATTVSTSAADRLACADLSGDGRPEVVTIDSTGAVARVFVNDGAGSFTLGASVPTGPGPSGLALADLDADGALDLAVACRSDDSLRLYKGSGVAFAAVGQLATGIEPSALVAVDLEHDGDLDLLLTERGSSRLAVYRGDGQLGFAAPERFSTGASPEDLAVADFDGDGWLDVVVAEGIGDALALFRGGASGLVSATSLAAVGSPRRVIARDLDGDGDPDLAVALATTQQVALYTGLIDATFSAPRLAEAVSAAALTLGDLNGDGRADLISGGAAGSSLLRGDPGLALQRLEATGPTSAVGFSLPAARDACGTPTLTSAPASGAALPLGATTVECVATDTAGNRSRVRFQVVVEDTTAPSLEAPELVEAEQSQPEGALVTYEAPTASDLVDPNPSVVCVPPSGSLFPPGETQVTCTATDAAGNESQVSFVVRVSDTTPPTITQLADLAAEQTSAAGATVVYATPVATDAADPAPSVVCVPASGSLFPPGATTVTCTATDAAGNSTQVSFVVLVQDTTAPALSQPANLVVEQTSPAGATLNYAPPTASDGVDPNPVVTCVPAPGTLFPPGATTVTCTATDSAGNSSQVQFTVTVQDTIAPTLGAAPDLTVEQSAPNGTTVSFPLPTASDAADPAPTVACVPPSGSLFPPGATTVTCTATDAAGNASAPTTFVVTVQDTTAPTIAPSADLLVTQTSPAGAIVTYAPPAVQDAADPTPVVTCTPASGSLFPPGPTTVTCTATDAAGNSAAVTFVVTVRDQLPPTIGPAPDLSVEQQSPTGAIVTFSEPSVSDDTDPNPSVVCAPASGSLFPPGETTVTCTATDAGGNQAQVSFVVRVQDTTAPALSLGPGEGVTLDHASVALVASFSDVAGVTSFSASLDGVDVSASFAQDADRATWTTAPLADGPHVFSATVGDSSGNVTSQTVTFVVRATPVLLELSIGPGDPADLPVLSVNDLTLSARGAEGTIATSFTGFVLLTSSDGRAPFHGTVVELTPADQGTITVEALVVPRSVGTVELRARSIMLGNGAGGPATTISGVFSLEPRSIDGTGNNPLRPDQGSTHQPLARLGSSDYGDGVSAPAGPGRPGPREISNAVHRQARSIPNQRGASDLLWVWGQFVDHDLDLTGAASPTESLPIPVPTGDLDFDPMALGSRTIPFSRSGYLEGSNPRQQVNEITAWLDGSAIYGSDAARQQALRTNDGTGRLRVERSVWGDLLPRNEEGLPNDPTAHDPSFFLAGDVRANENGLLTAMHTLWVREHNRIADLIRVAEPGAPGDVIYERARRRVTIQLQVITYEEWLPVLLGAGALSPYQGYDSSAEVAIFNEFSTAAFRMGHSLLSPKLLRLDEGLAPIPQGNLVDLRDAFFSPSRVRDEGGIEPLLRGAALQVCQRLDAQVVEDVRSFLFGPPGSGGLDLPALNLQRGRDHGLPSYNDLRRALGLSARTSFAEVSSDPAVQANLASVYSDVERIDAWTGGLAEDHLPGAMVGELVFTVLKRQFELLRDGDRFWYERIVDSNELAEVRATRLSDVIRRNTTIRDELPDAVFAPYEAEIEGQLELEVTIDAPLVSPTPPSEAPTGAVTIAGYSFPGQPVELLLNGTVFATTHVADDGSYSFSLALDPGSYTLTTRALDSQGAVTSSAPYVLSVPPPPLTSLTLEPSALALALGQQDSLTATSNFANGEVSVDPFEVRFESSAPSIASVDSFGVVKAVAPGSAVITAQSQGFSASTSIEVGAIGLASSSPANGEEGVGLTRETILRFSAPLDVASVSPSAISATRGDEPLAARLHVSPDAKTVTVFYDELLPPASRVRVRVDGAKLLAGGSPVDANGDGLPGGVRTIDFDTLNLDLLDGTSVCGRVFASELAPVGTGSVNTPLANVRISIDGLEDTAFTFTDGAGNFRLEPVPSGRFFVHIDGRTSTAPIDSGAYYPFVGKTWAAVGGQETSIGDVYLPLVQPGSLQAVSETAETTIGFAPSVVAQRPEFAVAQVVVPADSLYANDGTRGGQVGIAPVPPDRLPGPLPEGLNPPLVVTIQTDGATNFDVPVTLRLPNLEGLPPGSLVALYSFNHDTGEFEVVGQMQVSADGTYVETLPGTGVLAPGWHFAQRGSSGRGGTPTARGSGTDVGTSPAKQPTPSAPNAGKKESQTKEGDPINLQTGEEIQDRVDLEIPARNGLRFRLARRYRSQFVYDGVLGYGWTHDYLMRLQVGAGGALVAIQTPQSFLGNFVRNPDSTYRSPEGMYSTLRQLPDGSFELLDPDGLKHCFASDGLLECQEDRWGNRLTFRNNEFGHIASVIDTFGREVEFFYEDLPSAFFPGVLVKRLVRVRDFAGREVKYTYDARGDLIEARTPVVTGTSTGNDFPEGRTERFAYSHGFAQPELNHNLIAYTSPEEVAKGGPPRVTWTYGTDPADPASFDRVVTEVHGGTNASGVPAGGSSSISYTLLNQGAPPNPDTPRLLTRFTDRNGNVSEHYANESNYEIIHRRLTRGLRPGEPAFYETRSYYNSDGELTRRVFPEGNEIRYRYQQNGLRRSAGNVVEIRRVAGPRGGGEDLVTTLTYEPLYNQVLTRTDPRGNSASFVPPLGDASPDRYTTRFFYDYQEHTDPLPLEQELDGVALTDFGVQRGLGDLNGDGRLDQSFGNPIRVQAPSVTLRPEAQEALRLGSTTQEVITETQWNDHGQVVAVIDAEGNVSRNRYYPANDPDGDGRLVPQQYVSVGADESGYLAETIADGELSPRRTATADPAALATRMGYDEVGNLTSTLNPRGVETRFEVTQLNEVILVVRGAEVTEAIARGELFVGSTPFAYLRRTTYDFNGRPVRVEVENRQDASAIQILGDPSSPPNPGAFVEREMEYDLLDNLVTSTVEVGTTFRLVGDLLTSTDVELTTRYRYDSNENLVEVTKPEGNRVATEFDERDLLLRATRGAGTPGASTRQVDYDLNGNPVRAIDAEDNDGDGFPEVTTTVYDGFDRVVEVRDPLGNRVLTRYDVASNLLQTQVFGHPAGMPTGTPVELSDVRTSYDELGRAFRTDQRLFLSSGFTTTRAPQLLDDDSDGFVTSFAEFDALSRLTHAAEDDGEITRTIYDGVSRPVETVDALGNRVLTTYDRNSNPLTVTSVEISPEGLVPPESFTTRYVYDQLDRVVRATDNAGQTTYFRYDSRDNLVERRDPVGPATSDPLGVFPGTINGPGNSKTYFYDGLDRMVRQVCDLRVGGTGAGAPDISNAFNPDGQISLSYEFDGNSRLVGIVDDNGNRTRNVYDALDRRVTHVYAIDDLDSGGTRRERFDYTYDRDDNVRTVTDPNGTVVTKSYDVLNRLTTTAIARAAGVGGTTVETFQYDGLSRLTRCTDDNGGPTTVQAVEKVYDSLSRLIEERQNGQVVSNVFTGDGKRLQCTYPGGRVIRHTFDAIDRIKTINDTTGTPTQIAACDWIGPGMRELRRQNANGTKLTFLNDAENANLGYDSVQRITRLRVLAPGGGSALVDREYGYNRASVRTFERRHDDFGLTDSYSYDSMYRVVSTALDTGGSVGATPRPTQQIGYVLDGVGNRRKVGETTGSGSTSEDYAVNQVNQYTSKGGVARSHSRNGNLLGDGTQTYLYDYKNRLLGVTRVSDGAPVAAYLYDCENRRTLKVVYSETQPGVVETETRFFYDGWRVCEDQSASGASELTYVYSPVYLDEPVQLRREAANPLGAGELWTHQNARADVVSVTDASGAVIERRFFDDFGKTYDETKALAGASSVGNPYGFQGRRFDPETGLYYFRNRYYAPESGRFLQRDPVWDAGNVGGQYTFVGNAPIHLVDPYGEQSAGELADWLGNKIDQGVAWTERKLQGLSPSYDQLYNDRSMPDAYNEALAWASGFVEGLPGGAGEVSKGFLEPLKLGRGVAQAEREVACGEYWGAAISVAIDGLRALGVVAPGLAKLKGLRSPHLGLLDDSGAAGLGWQLRPSDYRRTANAYDAWADSVFKRFGVKPNYEKGLHAASRGAHKAITDPAAGTVTFYGNANLATKMREAFRILQSSARGIWRDGAALRKAVKQAAGEGGSQSYGIQVLTRAMKAEADAFLKGLGFRRPTSKASLKWTGDN